jgi:hypothetical protein
MLARIYRQKCVNNSALAASRAWRRHMNDVARSPRTRRIGGMA